MLLKNRIVIIVVLLTNEKLDTQYCLLLCQMKCLKLLLNISRSIDKLQKLYPVFFDDFWSFRPLLGKHLQMVLYFPIQLCLFNFSLVIYISHKHFAGSKVWTVVRVLEKFQLFRGQIFGTGFHSELGHYCDVHFWPQVLYKIH